MKIRTVTFFINGQSSILEKRFRQISSWKKQIAEISKPYDVQTIRITLTSDRSNLQNASIINDLGNEYDIPFINIGQYDSKTHSEDIIRSIDDTKNISISCPCTSIDDAYAIAGIMKELASLDIMNNFRFCGGMNLKPHIPFFPSSFTDSNEGFAMGLEWGDLLFTSLHENSDINMLDDTMHSAFSKIQNIGLGIENITDMNYLGTDFSLNPSVNMDGSIAYAFDAMLGHFGNPGTLSLIKQITDILHNTDLRKTGYNGVMLPVMEDRGLADYWEKGLLDIDRLILYSSVCGCGLDMIPVPGDISTEYLGAVINDLGSLSDRYDKQLSARILPMPGLSRGDRTSIDSPYVVNTAV